MYFLFPLVILIVPMTIKYLLVKRWVFGIRNDVIRTGSNKMKFQIKGCTFIFEIV